MPGRHHTASGTTTSDDTAVAVTSATASATLPEASRTQTAEVSAAGISVTNKSPICSCCAPGPWKPFMVRAAATAENSGAMPYERARPAATRPRRSCARSAMRHWMLDDSIIAASASAGKSTGQRSPGRSNSLTARSARAGPGTSRLTITTATSSQLDRAATHPLIADKTRPARPAPASTSDAASTSDGGMAPPCAGQTGEV